MRLKTRICFDEITSSSSCEIDGLDIAAHRTVVRKFFQNQLGKSQNRHQSVVEVVRHTASQGAERLQLLRMHELAFQLVALPLCFAQLGDVPDHANELTRLARDISHYLHIAI